MLPFTFGAPVPPELFFNRETEIKLILARATTIRNGLRNDLALIGPRRVGKSSLLSYLQKELEEDHFTCIKLDCEGHDLFSFLKEYGNSILEAELAQKGLVNLRERLKKGFTETLATLAEALGLKALEISIGEFIKLRIEVEKTSTNRALSEQELYDFFMRTVELPEKIGRKYVIMLDEFQETKNFSGNFHALYRNFTQNQRNVNYIYTGSAIGMIQEIFGDPQNPLAGNVELIYIEPFSPETTRLFFQKKLQKVGKSLSSSSIEFIYQSVGGFPAYLNWLGLRLLDVHPEKGEIPHQIVLGAYEQIVSFQSPIYQMIERQLVRLGRVTKNILRLIAYGYTLPSQISKESEVKNIYVYLNRLEKYGLIRKENKEYYLIDPVIQEYLKRK